MSSSFILDSKGRPVIDKDPDALLDYTFDWSAYLTALFNDTIVSVLWTVDITSGIVVASQSNSTTTATAWVSGGILGTTAILSCKITTISGRIDERQAQLKIKDL